MKASQFSAVPPEFRPVATAAAIIGAIVLVGAAVRLFDSSGAAPSPNRTDGPASPATSPATTPPAPPEKGALNPPRKLPMNVSELPFETEPEKITTGNPRRSRSHGPTATQQGLDAAMLLAYAAADEKGVILASEVAGQLSITVGTRNFCRPQDGPREAAKWREALDQLQTAGLVELVSAESIGPAGFHAHRQGYRVTARGYSVADRK